MGGGLAFLSKKRFNPSNVSNQRQVWEARQRTAREEERMRKREEQLRRERDDEDLARARGGRGGGDRAQLGFMYGVPPGLRREGGGRGEGEADVRRAEADKWYDFEGDKDEVSGEQKASNEREEEADATKRRPGDDDAAAAFRAMFAASASASASDPGPTSSDGVASKGPLGVAGGAVTAIGSTHDPNAASASTESGDASKVGGAAAHPGSDNRTQLEKAVGRRQGYSQSLTLEEQVARFPQLAYAPVVEGMKSSDAGVNFKPMGVQIRNVRCLRCGVWGHSRGDRECKLGGWDPFAAPIVAPAAGGGSGGAPQDASAAKEAKITAAVASDRGERMGGEGTTIGSSTARNGDVDEAKDEMERRARGRAGRRRSDEDCRRGSSMDESERCGGDEEGRRRRSRTRGKRRSDRGRRRHRDRDGSSLDSNDDYDVSDSDSYREERRRERKRKKRKRYHGRSHRSGRGKQHGSDRGNDKDDDSERDSSRRGRHRRSRDDWDEGRERRRGRGKGDGRRMSSEGRSRSRSRSRARARSTSRSYDRYRSRSSSPPSRPDFVGSSRSRSASRSSVPRRERRR